MRLLDASSIISGWDNYRIQQFPPVWSWLQTEIDRGQLCISSVAFKEVDHKSPECGNWLREAKIEKVTTSNSILLKALDIKNQLGITGDNYHPKGVGENDLLIVATAKIGGFRLVSDESFQNNLPVDKKRYKIPAVCSLGSVCVPCENFLSYLSKSGKVFI